MENLNKIESSLTLINIIDSIMTSLQNLCDVIFSNKSTRILFEFFYSKQITCSILCTEVQLIVRYTVRTKKSVSLRNLSILGLHSNSSMV